MWNDEIEAGTSKKFQAKLGRRANQNKRESSEEFSSTDDILKITNEDIPPAPVVKKTGGWADETLKSAKSRPSINLIEQERFQDQKSSFEDDIPIIPDLDDIPDDILSTDVAQAPAVKSIKATTYRELDKDLLKQNSFSQIGDINLSHLTRFLYTEKNIQDADVVWTKESLFNELISDYRGSVKNN